MVSWREDVHDDFAWQTPVNVGSPVNSSDWQGKVTNHGSDFFFASPVQTRRALLSVQTPASSPTPCVAMVRLVPSLVSQG